MWHTCLHTCGRGCAPTTHQSAGALVLQPLSLEGTFQVPPSCLQVGTQTVFDKHALMPMSMSEDDHTEALMQQPGSCPAASRWGMGMAARGMAAVW
jgi:hypothetical protein